MKKKLIVTGGLGFIGSNLVKLLTKKYFVYIIDNNSYSANINNLKELNQKNFSIIKLNICNKKKFEKVLNKIKPIGIFHLAAETHVDRSIDNARLFINTNIIGTFNILETLKNYKKKNKKIKLIHISTDEVYGDIPKKKFSKESDAYEPSSPYAASKAASDHLVKSYFRTYNVPVILTNCCNNYGPRQFPEKLIPKLIINIIKNKNLPIYGDGRNEREWIYVDDHNRALIKIFEKGKLGNSYNIGSGEIVNNYKISNLLLKIYKKKLKLKTKSKVIYVKDRPGHDRRYALDSKKIKKELKWKLQYKLEIGMLMTIKWYLENKDWIKKISKKHYSKRLGLAK